MLNNTRGGSCFVSTAREPLCFRSTPSPYTSVALEQTAVTGEGFNRLFLRTPRALRELRRYAVIVTNAGQVNIGERQVNVAEQ
jgi:hypothetical protein